MRNDACRMMGVVETLRGRKMTPYTDVSDIPCRELSDVSSLCRNPLVTVRIVTYNHERYICQAIESVMAQRTNFEYELVIGEDASSDRTRVICFELQKKYPEKIRVLWSEENMYAVNGNAIRTDAHCRGEYMALLEGDDYWTDQYKLQKQIDLIRKTGAVGCMAWRKDLLPDGRFVSADSETKPFLEHEDLFSHYYHTSTYVYKRSVVEAVLKKYPEITEWYDTQMAHCVREEGRICLLPEEVSVYRRTGFGIATSLRNIQQRLALSMSQLIPMYLWGPKILRRDYGLMVLMMLAHSCCHKEQGYSEDVFRLIRKDVYALFWRMQINMFPSWCAFLWLLRMVKYRICVLIAHRSGF